MDSYSTYTKQIISAAIIAFILDAIVIGWLAKPLFDSQLNLILRSQFAISHLLSGVIVYLVIALGQVYFVKPARSMRKDALKNGAMFGFVTYAIYEFTNYALVTNWSPYIVMFDVIWGTLLNVIIAYVLWKLFSKK